MHRSDEVLSLRRDIFTAIDRLDTSSRLETLTIRELLEKIHQESEVSQDDISLLSQRTSDLAFSLTRLSLQCKQVSYDQSVLQRLHFERMGLRYHDVPEAHAQTFRWIFEDKLPSSDKPLEFTEWMRTESGIYWVMGKAGCGKSTLIKFIYRHKRTMRELGIWAGSKRLVCAEFFFWNAGSELEKSFKGLLRGLLFEVLRQCPSFIQQLWPHLGWDVPYDRIAFHWTTATLLDSLKKLVQFKVMPVRFCFFIDGLDEYESTEGDHSGLVKMLEKLTISADIKLCVSNRPWFVFHDAFGGNLKRYMKLEDLTREDIKMYVHSKLEESARFRQLRSEDAGYIGLEDEVVEKAEGVFLWVYLVVQSLLRGMTQADQISTLQERLRAPPTRLDEYFQHMLDSIEPVYRSHTAQTFQKCLAASEPLSLMTYWFLDEHENFDLYAKLNPLTEKEVLRRHDDMRRRLDGRTKGLLEAREKVGHHGPKHPISTHYVGFLHRTARDFVKSRDVQQMLQPYVSSDFNAEMRIVRALLTKSKALPTTKIIKFDFEELLTKLVRYEMRCECQPNADFEELNKIIMQAEKVAFGKPNQPMKGKRTAFVVMLVTMSHFRYVSWRIKQTPLVIHSHQRAARMRPLLNFACCNFHDDKWFNWDFSFTQEHMVRLILEAGESPNLRFKDTSCWRQCLEVARDYLRDLRTGRVAYLFDLGAKQRLMKIVRLFVLHGADLNEEMKVSD